MTCVVSTNRRRSTRSRKSPSLSDCVSGTSFRTITTSLQRVDAWPTSGHFRGAGAFLDEHLTRDQEGWKDGDYLRFYLGTIWVSRRADLTPVYAMIFRRLKAVAAAWVYHVPDLGIVELGPVDDDTDNPGKEYSVSQAAVAELEAQQRRAEVERFRAELREINARARDDAMDQPPPATVRAYRQVHGRDPRGWPPA
jgi:hypothetical protein